MSAESTSSSGIGLGSLVFVAFLVMKLGGIGAVASWSWWWVTCPLWIPIAVVLAIWLVVGLFALVFAAVSR